MYGIGIAIKRISGNGLQMIPAIRDAVQWRELFVMAVCARARIGPGITPFAAAYFAAGMKDEKKLPAMLAGCALGAFCTGTGDGALFAPVSCALALIFGTIQQFVSTKIPRFRMSGSSAAALNAGLSVLLPMLASVGYDPLMWLGSIIVAVAAAITAPVFMAKDVWWCAQARQFAAACAVTLCAAGIGIAPEPVAVFCTVAAGAAGRGAIVGALLGIICIMEGGGAEGTAMLSIAGAAADIAPGKKAIGRALAGCAAYAAFTAFSGSDFNILIPAAAALTVFIPRSVSESIEASCIPPRQRDGRLLKAMRRRDEARLRALSDAFAGLSDVCGAGDPAFGEQQLITRMRSALCAGCPEYARCWPGANSGAIKLFCQLMTAAIECGGSPFTGGEVPPEIMRLCRRGVTVPARLGNLLADFAAQRHRRIRLMEARRLIAAQFSQAAVALNAMAHEQARPFALRDGAAAHVKRALADDGYPVGDVLVLKMDQMEVNVALNGRWNREKLDSAAKIISRTLDMPYILHNISGNSAVFVPGGMLKAETMTSALPADPDHPCGDSSIVREMGRRMFVAISDGMGSGEAAAEESRRVISLMHSLVSAGLPRELALTTINGVLLSRGGEELFATADMLVIDLDSGRAEFTKLAASRSYIVRGNNVHVIEGGRLPLGILDDVQPGVKCADLKRGDVVFMMTDGVTDAFTEKQLTEVMLRTVRSANDDPARCLVDEAARNAHGRRDDMTAVCVRIA